VFSEKECSQSAYEAALVVLSESERLSTPSCEIEIEALVFKTDIANTTNFEVRGITGLKNEQFGVKPFTGTQLSYGEKEFDSMDELVDFLKDDSRVEILGFSKNFCKNHQIVRMFEHSDSLGRKLAPDTLESLVINQEDGVSLENTLCLKPEIYRNWRVDLTIFLEKATLMLDPFSNGEFVLLPRDRYTLASIPVPDRSFALLPGLILEGNNEPTFGRTTLKPENAHSEFRPQRSIVLILRPFIFKE
jgi:hypothetical protein